MSSLNEVDSAIVASHELPHPESDAHSSASPLSSTSSLIQDLKEFYCLERRTVPEFLLLLHIASFGKQGSGLGSDESHVSMLTAKIFNIREQSVG